MTIIRADPNKINPLFLAEFLNSELGLKQTDQHARGSAQREIYPDNLKHYLIWLPDRTVQDEIAQRAKAAFESQQAAR
ncbi:MAG: restriction endonuclease subunit S domain-containing protein [Aggregatilineales bacterium]